MIENLIPYSHKTTLANGNEINNDGRTILTLFRTRNAPALYDKIYSEYTQGLYERVAMQLEEALEKYSEHNSFYMLAMLCCFKQHDYAKAKSIAILCMERCKKLDDEEYTNIGVTYFYVEEYERSLQYSDKALKINPENVLALFNKGYCLTKLGYYEQAIPILKKVVVLNPMMAEAHNSLGLARIMIGHAKEGLRNVQESIRLDATNAYAFRNLGLFYKSMLDPAQAFQWFQKAKEMNPGMEGIDDLIAAMQSRIK